MIPTKKFHCNCEKSKCQKKYCECFANNEVCDVKCDCRSCKNCSKDALDKMINNLPSTNNKVLENNPFLGNYQSTTSALVEQEMQNSNSDLALNDYPKNSKFFV